MLNSVKSLGYIKYHSLSRSRPVKGPSNSIRQNCQKLCSWLGKTQNHTGNQKKGHVSLGDQQSYYLQFFNDFTNHRKKTNRAVLFSSRPFPNILKACVRYFLSNFYLSPNDSPSKFMKNAFYFIYKALFLLEIFSFLHFCLPIFFSLSAIALQVDQR